MKRWLEALRLRLIDARREPRRMPAGQRATLTIAGRDEVVRVLDLSDTGAMIAFAGPAAEGEVVILHLLDRAPVRGQVRWSRGGRVGIGSIELADEETGSRTGR